MLSADFSAEVFKVRREWYDIFKVLKGENKQPRILYSAILLFRIEGERKNFSDKQKLKKKKKKVINTKSTLEEMLQDLNEKVRIYSKEKNPNRKSKYIVRIENYLNKPLYGLKDKKNGKSNYNYNKK